MSDLFSVDVCERKHGGADTSIEAFQNSLPARQRDSIRVLEVFRSDVFRNGATLKDVCECLEKEKNEVSGRISELLKMNKIIPTGEKRDACRVYRAVAQ